MKFLKRTFLLLTSTFLVSSCLIVPVMADSNSAFQALVSQYPSDYQKLHDAGISDAKLKSFLGSLLGRLESDSSLSDANFDKTLIFDAISIAKTDADFSSKLLGLFSSSELAEAAKGIVPPELIPVRNIMKQEWQDALASLQGSENYTITKGSDGVSIITFKDDAILQGWQKDGQSNVLQVQIKDATVSYQLQFSANLMSKGKELNKVLLITTGQTVTPLSFADLPDQTTALFLQPVVKNDVMQAATASSLQLAGTPADMSVSLEKNASSMRLLKGNTYAETDLPVPSGTDGKSIGAYTNLSGKAVPVPFSLVTNPDGTTTAKIYHLGTGGFFLATQEVSFSDLDSHWSKDYVQVLVQKGVLSGYEDGTFGPDKPVTRAEFASMLTRALGILPMDESASNFSDVSSGNWYSGSVAAALNAKLVNGDEKGNFRPDDTLTRSEAAVMLSNAMDFLSNRFVAKTEIQYDNLPINDKTDVPQWAQPTVAKVVSEQLMQGDEHQVFHPEALTTRGQVAVMLDKLLNLSNLASK